MIHRVLLLSQKDTIERADLPPDLAFVTLVESDFKPRNQSHGGNAGLWQFERATARRNGLRVNAKIDERLDPQKSTTAACRYFSRLQQIFGPEASLLVMVAAYNLGPTRLQARMRTIHDPAHRGVDLNLREPGAGQAVPGDLRFTVSAANGALLVSQLIHVR